MNKLPRNTIVRVELPLQKWPGNTPPPGRFKRMLSPIFRTGKVTQSDMNDRLQNTTRIIAVFGWIVCTIERNEAHYNSEAERASRYLMKWVQCEDLVTSMRATRSVYWG